MMILGEPEVILASWQIDPNSDFDASTGATLYLPKAVLPSLPVDIRPMG